MFIKTPRAKKSFLHINVNNNEPNSEIQRASFYIYKKQKKCKTFIYIRKSRHFAKSKTVCVTLLFTKYQTLYVSQFFMKFLKLGFLYTKNMTLCVTWSFYIQKTRHFKKSKIICVKFLIYKNSDTLRYAIFHGMFVIGGGGRGAFSWKKNNSLFVKFLYAKNIALSVTFLYTKSQTLCVTCNIQKTMHFPFCCLSKIICIVYSDT